MKFAFAKIFVVLSFHVMLGNNKEIGKLEDKDIHGIGGVVFFDAEENLFIITQFQ